MDDGLTSGTPHLTEAAGRLLDALRESAPDTGDDETQVALDDALEAIEIRVRRLVEAMS